MKRYRVLMLAFIFFTSCNDNSYIPSGIIKPPQMQQIFWDIIRGDVLAQEIVKKDSTKNIKTESFVITEKIFSIHHTNKENFEKSIAFYSKHPQMLRIIFDSLNARQTRKTSIERNQAKKMEEQKTVRKYRDSLNIIKTK